MVALPSYQRVRELLDYDPETGVVVRRKSGKPVGWRCSGHEYLMVGVGGRHHAHLLHRIIWLWMTGRVPRFIDHENLQKRDNRWVNLRECSKSENQANRTKRKDNTSGFKGVDWDASRGLWRAQICRGGQRFFIGRFKDRESASAAHLVKATELFGEFARAE